MANKQRVSEIRISRRTIEIGHEVYPLANISRVRTHRLEWAGKYATFQPLRSMVSLAVWVIVIEAVAVVGPQYAGGQYGLDQAAQQFAALVLALAGARAVWLLGVLLYRLLLRPTFYKLVIETAGAQSTALHGTDLTEITRIRGLIVAAIEDPPASMQTFQIYGDVFGGDKFTGKDYTVNKAGRDVHQHR